MAKGKGDPHVSTERIEEEGPPSSPPMEEKRARPRGRPALPAEKGKRYAIGIRTTKALKDALLSASRASGRSLAQEIEFRLEREQNLEKIVIELIKHHAREATEALASASRRLEKVAAELAEMGDERDTPPGTRRRRQRRREGQPKADD